MSAPTVAAFDVDGTLTTRDSVVPFLLTVAGRLRLALGIARQPLALARGIAGRDRDQIKAVAVRAAYAGRTQQEIDALGRDYCRHMVDSLMRPDTLGRLRWHQSQGHSVVLVSASLAAYLRPLAELLALDGVLCTDGVVGSDGRYTGDLLDGNCRGPEKQRRLRAWMVANGLADATVWAYGDSAGDREMLAAAAVAVTVKDTIIPEVPEAPEVTP